MNSAVVNYNNNDITIFYPVNTNEPVIKCIMKKKLWETNIIKEFENEIQLGDTVLDIGGYVGTHTTVLSKIVGDLGRVFTFEPQPLIYKCLKKTIKTNRLTNVTLINKCVSNNNNRVLFTATNNGRASITTIRPNLKDGADNKVWVKSITIDDLKLERCDFIKIDVELCELLVLEGAMNTILKYKPKIIIEVFPRNFDYIEGLLCTLDYKIKKNLSCHNYLCEPMPF